MSEEALMEPVAEDDRLTRSFEFDITFSDLVVANGYRSLHGFSMRWAVIITVALMEVMLAGVFILVVTEHKRLWHISLLWPAVTGFAAVVVFELWREVLTMPLTARRAIGRLGKRKVVTNERYVELTNTFGQIRYRWSSFAKIAHHRGWVILSFPTGDMLLIPISAFPSATAALEFVAIADQIRIAQSRRTNVEKFVSAKGQWPPQPTSLDDTMTAPLIVLQGGDLARVHTSLDNRDRILGTIALIPASTLWAAVLGIAFGAWAIAVKAGTSIWPGGFNPVLCDCAFLLLTYYGMTSPMPQCSRHTQTGDGILVETDFRNFNLATPTVAFSCPVRSLRGIRYKMGLVIVQADVFSQFTVPSHAFGSADAAKAFVGRMRAAIAAGKTNA